MLVPDPGNYRKYATPQTIPKLTVAERDDLRASYHCSVGFAALIIRDSI